MSYNLLPTSSLWQLKLSRKFDGKLTSTGTVICHLYSNLCHFSPGQHKSCESERKIKSYKSFSCESQIRGYTRKKAPRGGGHRLLTNPSDDKALHNRPVNLYHCDHRAWDLMHAGISCDIQSQYRQGGRNTCSDEVCVPTCVCRGEVDVEPTEISPLHHWVNGTTDVSCDFTAASWRVTLKPTHEHIAHQSEWGVRCFLCLCRGKQWQPPSSARLHTWNV